MDELMDLIATDESPSQISDKIKDMIYAKAAVKVDEFKPKVASSVFDASGVFNQQDGEGVSEPESEEESEEEE